MPLFTFSSANAYPRGVWHTAHTRYPWLEFDGKAIPIGTTEFKACTIGVDRNRIQGER